MTLAAGTRLGQYRVLSSLGAGGMGEVYRARDSRLGREVAIKVLPETLGSDSERLARFEREAKALAALNHPNIATLYGFESQPPELGASDSAEAREGLKPATPTTPIPFLVMELVEGETLAERLQGGALSIEERGTDSPTEPDWPTRRPGARTATKSSSCRQWKKHPATRFSSAIRRRFSKRPTRILNLVRDYAVADNGQRFLFLKPRRERRDVGELVLVQNWFGQLQRLVPTD
jgi:hypothetical protein